MTDRPEDSDDALMRLFVRFDTNADGLIDEAEFLAILHTLGEDPSNEVLSLEFAAIDANADDMVDFHEFQAWWRDYQ